MRTFLVLYILFCFICLKGKAQSGDYSFRQLYELDSLGQSNSVAKHFGSLYYTFLLSIEKQLSSADSVTKRLVRRFEAVFAQFYIDACISYQNNKRALIQAWQPYFDREGLQPIQYKLLGANAHLNGGLWQALTNSFTNEEMNQLKDEFVIFKKTLNKTYKKVYKEALTSNKRVQKLRLLTVGIDELLGNYYLYKWRKRQMRIARLYWTNSSALVEVLKKVDSKKLKIDGLILKML